MRNLICILAILVRLALRWYGGQANEGRGNDAGSSQKTHL